MTHNVYELINPAIDRRFYIGHSGKPERRLREHLRYKCVSTGGMVFLLEQQGIKPVMRLVAEFPSKKEAHEWERKMIRDAKRAKEPLCNYGYGRVLHPNKRNHGAKVTDSDLKRADELNSLGMTLREIALDLRRSVSSVRHMLKRLPSQAQQNALA
jgi:predicted GIY-YIG superfamily endonuclease